MTLTPETDGAHDDVEIGDFGQSENWVQDLILDFQRRIFGITNK